MVTVNRWSYYEHTLAIIYLTLLLQFHQRIEKIVTFLSSWRKLTWIGEQCVLAATVRDNYDKQYKPQNKYSRISLVQIY